jgi:hypothetical protein
VTDASTMGPMRFEQFAAWLSQVERSLPVATWAVDRVEAWPMVRLNLYHRNFNPVSKSSDNAARRYFAGVARVPRELSAWALARFRDRKAEKKWGSPADAVLLAYSVGAQPEIAGRRVNPLLAPYVSLIEDAGATAAVWEMCPYGDYNVPRSNPSTLIQPRVMLDRIRSRVFPVKDVAVNLPGWTDLESRIRAARLRWSYADVSILHGDAHFVRILADRFGRGLARAHPSVGFTADYGLPEQAFCLACHEAGTLSVEIQHGVQGVNHAAYGAWDALPPGGFSTLPSAYWCWTAEAAKTINAWAAGAGIRPGAFVGGDAWLATWQDSMASVTKKVDADLIRLGAGGQPGIDVLLALSCVGQVVPPILHDALVTASSSWRSWTRLHPVNQPQQRKALFSEVAELGIITERLNAATQAPLPGLLKWMDVQVVVGPSTLIMQAAQFGVPSVVIGVGAEEAENLFPAEFARGMVRMASTGGELLELVASLSKRKRRPAASHLSSPQMVGRMKQLVSRSGEIFQGSPRAITEDLVVESAR